MRSETFDAWCEREDPRDPVARSHPYRSPEYSGPRFDCRDPDCDVWRASLRGRDEHELRAHPPGAGGSRSNANPRARAPEPPIDTPGARLARSAERIRELLDSERRWREESA